MYATDIIGILTFVVIPALIVLFGISFWIKQYRRCSSNEILVITGKIGGDEGRSARCIHGGGQFVWPIIQQYDYLSLDPFSFDVDLQGALAKNNIRVNIPCNFTLGISVEPNVLQNAAKRLLGADLRSITQLAQDIIFGQLRLVVAGMDIEEINNDRDKFLMEVNKNVGTELAKVGLEVLNVNIRDITDQAGYIEALGKKAAEEAIQNANIEVATQKRHGEVGVSSQDREREIKVAEQRTETAVGKKEQEQRERTQVASFEAEAVKGENEASIRKALYDAELAEKKAEALRRSQVAEADAQKAIFEAHRAKETAKLQAEQIVKMEIEKQKIEIQAEADKEKVVKAAEAEAEGIRQKYFAEAEGIEKVMEAKAKGYEKLMATFGQNHVIAPTMLMIEQMPELVRAQVQAIKDIKIDKITVWEGGGGSGEHATSNFLKGLIGSLPQVHELAKQAGINLPAYFGNVTDVMPDEHTPSAPTKAKVSRPSTTVKQ